MCLVLVWLKLYKIAVKSLDMIGFLFFKLRSKSCDYFSTTPSIDQKHVCVDRSGLENSYPAQ